MSNVPVEKSLINLEKFVLKYPNVSLSIKTFKDSGHGLFDPSTDWVRSDYLDYVDGWIKAQN